MPPYDQQFSQSFREHQRAWDRVEKSFRDGKKSETEAIQALISLGALQHEAEAEIRSWRETAYVKHINF